MDGAIALAVVTLAVLLVVVLSVRAIVRAIRSAVHEAHGTKVEVRSHRRDVRLLIACLERIENTLKHPRDPGSYGG